MAKTTCISDDESRDPIQSPEYYGQDDTPEKATDKDGQITSAINILPNEILSEILTLAAYSDGGDQERHLFPAALCLVSRLWRAVALQTPRVWSFILIRNEHTLRHVQSRLVRTGNVPLEIKINNLATDETYTDKMDPATVMAPLLPLSHRWKILSLTVCKVADYIIRFPPTLPGLRDLLVADEGSSSTFDISLPQLQFMRLDATSIFWSSTTCFPNLTTFYSISGSGGDNLPIVKLLTLLQSAPNLEILELCYIWDLDSVDDTEFCSLQRQAVTLPRLTDLRLDGLYAWELVAILSLLRAPGVNNLMLSVFRDPTPPPRPFSLETLQISFPSLQHLILKNLTITPAQLLHVVRQMPPIKRLSILDLNRADMGPFLKTIITDPSTIRHISNISEISIKGLSIITLLRCLSHPTLPQSFISALTLRVHHDAFQSPSNDSEEEMREHADALTKLRVLVPNLRGVEDEPWWDDR